MKILWVSIGCAMLAACATPTARDVQPFTAWPAATRDFSSPAEILRVADEFPNSMGMQRRKLGALMQAKDTAAILSTAQQLAAMGAVLSPGAQKQIADVVGTEAFAPTAAQFAANAAPFGSSSIYAIIPADQQLIEGVIWDSTAKRLYATSVADRRLLQVSAPSAATVSLESGLEGLLGGVYDPRRRRLWIASGAALGPPTPPAFSGLVAFEPATGQQHRIPAPQGATLGDVAVAGDGTVYTSDGLKGAVYRCAPGCTSLETVVAPGGMFSAQGMAVSRDQKWLYVADRRYGLAAIERNSGRIVQVSGEAGMMLDGIDGLARDGDDLIAIQSAYPPARIIRLRLAPGGLRVASLEVLERANPEWGEVTLGTVADRRLLYVADAQYGRFGEDGKPIADKPAKPTPIRSLPLP